MRCSSVSCPSMVVLRHERCSMMAILIMLFCAALSYCYLLKLMLVFVPNFSTCEPVMLLCELDDSTCCKPLICGSLSCQNRVYFVG
jgi:hypothetical protein